jgi:hypothetical protein
MKILSDWVDVGNGLRGRAVEYTDEEWAQAIPLEELLRVSKRDFSENKDLCENRSGK